MLGGVGIGLSVKGLSYTGGSDIISLAAGRSYILPPGQWLVRRGPYTYIQFLDPVTNLWRTTAEQTPGESTILASDGANVRLANLTGCPVGAVITNAGTGYTSAPTVTPSAGGSRWRAIVGGAVNTTVTLPSFPGSNYTYPPTVIISPPPPGGIPATARAVITAGAVSSIVVTNQGAGYLSPPTLAYVSDPNDPNNPIYNPATTTPINPIIGGTTTLTGAATVTAVVNIDPGNPLTATPTLAFAGGGGASAAATALMNYTVTSFTVTAAGVGYGNAQPLYLFGTASVSGAVPIYTNPAIEKGITQPRQPFITTTTTAGGALQTAGAIVVDAGLGLQVSGTTLGVIPAGTAPPSGMTTAAVATTIVGGTDDYFVLIPLDA